MRLGFDARCLHETEPVAYRRYMVSLLRWLQLQSGVELFLFTDRSNPISNGQLEGVTASVIQLSAKRNLLWEQFHLPAALRRLEIDVYHAAADQGLPIAKACSYVLTRHGEMRAYIAHMLKTGELSGSEGDYFADLRPTHPLIRGLYLRARGGLSRWISDHIADRILTVSETAKNELVRFKKVANDKIRVTYLAAGEEFRGSLEPDDIERTRAKYDLPPHYLVSVGTVAKVKNTDGLLRCQAALRGMGSSLPLVVCAPTTHDLQSYRLLASALGLRESVDLIFLVKVGKDLPALYRGATVFVILSWYESFSLPVLEAMASGLPVIAANSASLPEIIGDGGLLVDPRRTIEIAATVKRVLDNPTLRQELALRAKRRSQAFSWERMAEQTFDIYKELIASSAARVS
jgi:glycosyltransferase involved in cell wall biosynthesis